MLFYFKLFIHILEIFNIVDYDLSPFELIVIYFNICRLLHILHIIYYIMYIIYIH